MFHGDLFDDVAVVDTEDYQSHCKDNWDVKRGHVRRRTYKDKDKDDGCLS